MGIIDSYLEHLNTDESIFPMDLIHTGRRLPKKVYKMNEDLGEEKEKILIDFDGVIHKYSNGWQDGSIYDDPVDGAKEAIDELKDDFEIVIFTTRASSEANEDVDDQIENVKNWLRDHEIYFDRITSEKLPAFAYIDDRGIHFDGDWSSALEEVKKRKLNSN